jgi:hypothetical protein
MLHHSRTNQMSATLDTHSADYLQTVAARTATILHPALLGTYLHGSAVLGGFAPPAATSTCSRSPPAR